MKRKKIVKKRKINKRGHKMINDNKWKVMKLWNQKRERTNIVKLF